LENAPCWIRTNDRLLEQMGGLDQRDQLLFKDIVRSNVLTASSGLLPGTPTDEELTLGDAWLEVFQEVLPRAKYRSAGMLVAEAYRTDLGQEPPLRQQFVDGAPRQVKSYRRSCLIDTLKRLRAQLAGADGHADNLIAPAGLGDDCRSVRCPGHEP
jgi:hypothetical protein